MSSRARSAYRSDGYALGWFAVASIGLVVFCGIGLLTDARVIGAAPAWLKPLKFAVSNALFAATLQWMTTQVIDRERFVRRLSMTTALLLGVEDLLICVQAVRGVTSHFNAGTVFDAALVSTMGLAILVIMAYLVALVVVLTRQGNTDPLRTSVRIALALTIAGGAIGGVMTVPHADQIARLRAHPHGAVLGAHSIGAPDGGPALPGTHWNSASGDLRVAHFIGVHALQVIPLIAWLISRSRIARRRQLRLVRIAGASYAELMLLLAWQALRGESVAHPGGLTLSLLTAWAVLLAIAVMVATRRPLAKEAV